MAEATQNKKKKKMTQASSKNSQKCPECFALVGWFYRQKNLI